MPTPWRVATWSKTEAGEKGAKSVKRFVYYEEALAFAREQNALPDNYQTRINGKNVLK